MANAVPIFKKWVSDGRRAQFLYFCGMRFIRNNLANAFTLANLFCGIVGIAHLFSGQYVVTFYCLLGSLILDFFDGFVARMMRADSALGTQLDSLADVVSFGVMPAFAMYFMLEPYGTRLSEIDFPFEIKYIALFIALFSCLRLAIFNLDEEQRYYFKGLNTPTNTIFIFGIYYNIMRAQNADGVFGSEAFLDINPWILLLITVASCWLLVSPLKMISMKFKSKALRDNVSKIVLLVGGILLIVFFRWLAMPLLVVYYIVISLLFHREMSDAKN